MVPQELPWLVGLRFLLCGLCALSRLYLLPEVGTAWGADPSRHLDGYGGGRLVTSTATGEVRLVGGYQVGLRNGASVESWPGRQVAWRIKGR